MPNDRREFFKKAGLLAGSALLWGKASQALDLWSPAIDSDIPTDDDEFWAWVSQQYTVSPNLMNLNNGGVSPQPIQVQQALQRYTEFCNEAPSYYMWRMLEPGRESVRRDLSALINAKPEEIAINRNATEALDTIIRGIKLEKGDEVVLSRYDYPRMMNAWKTREKNEGIVLKWVDLDFPEEDVDAIVEKYANQFTKRTKIVHLTHLINWSGQVMPAKEITEAAKNAGAKVLLDAAHTFAHLDFDIKVINCDYMGTSLHKWLCAPFGTGMMYVKEEEIPNIATVFYDDPEAVTSLGIKKFEELGTRNVPAELAIGNAINFHNTIGAKKKAERLHFLKNYWVDRVQVLTGVKIRTPHSADLSGAVGFMEIQGKEGTDIEAYLMEKYMIHTVSIKHESLNGVRITPNVYTTTADLDVLVSAIESFIDAG